MPEEFFFMIASFVLGIYAVFRGCQLFGRTFDPDPSQRWGCGRLTFAWFTWLLVSLLAVALFLPSISCDRGAARRAQCTNNLRQIVLGMHNYHDKYGCFPPAYSVDKNGRPLHSWRVLLLPFMEQKELYDRIRLDEPWNSPHNLSVFEPREPPFADTLSGTSCLFCPEDKENRTDTNYVTLLGPRTISDGPNCTRLKDISDGTSNTIAVVETYGPGIRWYEPRDLRADEMTFKINDPEYIGIASRHPGGAQVGLADGSVRFLPDDTDPRMLEAMTTINGGEDVSAVLDR
jgi:prepilin-type processing-associated H-X9-DG protein